MLIVIKVRKINYWYVSEFLSLLLVDLFHIHLILLICFRIYVPAILGIRYIPVTIISFAITDMIVVILQELIGLGEVSF